MTRDERSSRAPTPLEEKLLAHVHADNYQPVKPKVIARQLNLTTDDEKRKLKRSIKRLVKRGHLEYGRNHVVFPGSGRKKPEEAIGRFRRTRRGDGWVIPRHTGSESRPADIFIPRRRSLDAATGDLVRVRVGRQREASDRRRGAVVEILERETHRFVGTYYERGGEWLVTVDGNVFAHPIPVGDPGAKNVTSGDKVVIELVHFPSHTHEGEGVIVEVLGRKGQPGVDTLTIMREYDLPEAFPEEVLAAGHAVAEQFDEEIPSDRRDLTSWTIVTIDPVDARDFDDAISLERLDNGNWKLGVHIADVAHFVQPNTPLDIEARQRATSVYLPDRVLPMLPETISNLVASLQPDRVRYARSILIELSPDGTRLHTEVVKSAIRSCRRFAYEEVDQFLEDREAWREQLTPQVHRLLGDMHELAMGLRRRRLDGGAIELHLPEVKIDIDNRGEVVGAHREEYTESHQIIEEFMLAANMAVAELLSDAEIAFLRRIHEAPDPRKLKMLTKFVQELGYECGSLESRFEIKRVLEAARGKPEEAAVNFAVLKSMQKAIYSPEDVGHYALNATYYCHFTSPIRRYPDLTVHRIFDAIDAGKKPSKDKGPLFPLGEHCSERERRAESAERELIKIKLLALLAKRIGTTMPAVVTGVEEYGLFVQGTELPAEGLVHISTLQDDYYHYDETTHALVGYRKGHHFRLGDTIEVEIVRVSVDQREIDFRIIGHLERNAAERATADTFSSGERESKARGARGRGRGKGPPKGKMHGKGRGRRGRPKR